MGNLQGPKAHELPSREAGTAADEQECERAPRQVGEIKATFAGAESRRDRKGQIQLYIQKFSPHVVSAAASISRIDRCISSNCKQHLIIQTTLIVVPIGLARRVLPRRIRVPEVAYLALEFTGGIQYVTQ